MLIETSRFGPLEFAENVFIEFPWGIPGFEQVKRFVLLEHKQGPFQWLQAVDEPDLAFVVCSPEVMGVRYGVPEEKGVPIGIHNWDDLVVLVMVSFDRENKKISPHWCGPLLFNSAARVGYQWSMDLRELNKYIQTVEDANPPPDGA
jgi:flagellar assembly factor FliW